MFVSHGAARVVQEMKLRIHVRLWLLLQSVHTDAAVAKLVRTKRRLDSVAGRGSGGGDPVMALHERFLLMLPKARRKASARKGKRAAGAEPPGEPAGPTPATYPDHPPSEGTAARLPRKRHKYATSAVPPAPCTPSRTRVPPIGDTELASKAAPNPRRVAAGKRNRAKRKGLTSEGRQRLRELASEHQPWMKSTGPKTIPGKAKAAANGKRRQADRLSVRQLRAELAAVRSKVRELTALRA